MPTCYRVHVYQVRTFIAPAMLTDESAFGARLHADRHGYPKRIDQVLLHPGVHFLEVCGAAVVPQHHRIYSSLELFRREPLAAIVLTGVVPGFPLQTLGLFRLCGPVQDLALARDAKVAEKCPRLNATEIRVDLAVAP